MNETPEAVTALIDEQLAAYCEPNAEQRASAVAQLWAADGRLIDPPLASRGHDAIVAQGTALLAQFPAHRFRRTTAVHSHHGFARYGWALDDAQGRVVLEGSDFAEIDEHGRLRLIVGFFGASAPVGG